MISRLLSSLALVALLPSLSFAADIPDPTAWRDTVRDVYINGVLDRPTQVLVADAPRRVAILSARLPHAVIYNTEANVAWKASRDLFILTNDRLKATAEVKQPRRTTLLASTAEGVHSARVGRDLIVVAPHQSSAGPIAVDTFMRDYPAWGASATTYEPNGEASAQLAKVITPTTVKVFFATWCGDSKYYVPKVLGTLRAAANPNLTVELIGVGPDFHSPLDLVQQNRIINVPTFIVEQDGLELGRITETPASKTVEEDLASIVTGTRPRHEGRWEREAKIASGIYDLTSNGFQSGTEEWTLYSTPTGGRLLHSVVTRGEKEREVWQTYDEEGHTTFVEVTDRSSAGARRTRYRRGTDTMSAHSRGSDSGIIDQLVAVPDACGFDAGTAAGAASGCAVATTQTLTRFCIDDATISGRLARVGVTPQGKSTVEIAGQKIEAEHFESTSDGVTSEIVVDPTLGIPLQVASGDGKSAKLVSLTTY